MSSVTGRIREVKQPRGGYIKPSAFYIRNVPDDNVLKPVENIHPSLIGLVVDYMTRYMMGQSKQSVFEIAGRGAVRCFKMACTNMDVNRELSVRWDSDDVDFCLDGIPYMKNQPDDVFIRLRDSIQGLDDRSIIAACKLVTFDSWFRNTSMALSGKLYSEINPDADTIHNIRVMILRGVAFWEEYGPIVDSGFTFETPDFNKFDSRIDVNTDTEYYRNGGYTELVDSGDGDYLTADTLWDFKVSKNGLTNKITLQLVMYWIMGQHSGQNKYKSITKVGVFNPRLNVVYTLDVSTIPKNVISAIEHDVIGY